MSGVTRMLNADSMTESTKALPGAGLLRRRVL